MSENAELSIGQTLRAAREAHGMSQDDVAAHLRLMHRQIEAMESDDFASLGQSVFARGFVRNYARLLGLVPEDLLARMGGAPSEAAPITQAEPPPQAAWLTSPWLILMLLGTLIVVAVPVALYLWLNSEVDDGLPSRPPSTIQRGSAPVATPAPVAAPAAEPAPAPAPAANDSVLRFDFGGEAWVEVKDGSGRMVHRQLNPAGSRVDIQGQPPFDLVVGNAAQVRVHYNGRPIDLKPFIAVTVARFTLEE